MGDPYGEELDKHDVFGVLIQYPGSTGDLRDGARALGASLGEDPQVPRDDEREQDEGTPEDREDERVGGNLSVGVEHPPYPPSSMP